MGAPEHTRVDRWARQVLACASTGAYPKLSWLDGGPRSRSVVGLSPAQEVRSDDLAVLAELPRGYWIGWITYEAGVDATLGRAARPRGLPGVCLRRFDGLLAWGPSGIERLGDLAAASDVADRLETASPWTPGPWPLERLQPGIDADEYRRRVEVVLDEIRAGNTYQVNLSQPFRAPFTDAARGRPWSEAVAALYHGLRTDTPAPLGGLLFDGDRALVSNAPETLLDWKDGVVTSSPIKGTRPRGSTPHEDQANVEALLASAKDAAEHVMIVDLVRNDLGRIAAPGSVRACGRPNLVTLPTVHHLVTDVQAKLAALLLDLGGEYGVECEDGLQIGLKITHQEMANLIGSTRETISLTLAQFKKKSLLDLNGRTVVLRDQEGLSAMT